jgi:hypothetical protein
MLLLIYFIGLSVVVFITTMHCGEDFWKDDHGWLSPPKIMGLFLWPVVFPVMIGYYLAVVIRERRAKRLDNKNKDQV